MTAFWFSLGALLINVVVVLVLLARYYQARIDIAQQEADFWRREAGRHRDLAE